MTYEAEEIVTQSPEEVTDIKNGLRAQFRDEEYTIADITAGLVDQTQFLRGSAPIVALVQLTSKRPFPDAESRDLLAERITFLGELCGIVADRMNAISFEDGTEPDASTD